MKISIPKDQIPLDKVKQFRKFMSNLLKANEKRTFPLSLIIEMIGNKIDDSIMTEIRKRKDVIATPCGDTFIKVENQGDRLKFKVDKYTIEITEKLILHIQPESNGIKLVYCDGIRGKWGLLSVKLDSGKIIYDDEKILTAEVNI